jgi:class 3 adenylate cyclase
LDIISAFFRSLLVMTTGDGLLVEFDSVVDALRLAAELQARMAERSPNLNGLKR